MTVPATWYKLQRKTLVNTRFSNISTLLIDSRDLQNQNGDVEQDTQFIVKSIDKDFFCKPHNPFYELDVLQNLQHKHENIIQLIDSFDGDECIDLLFPKYDTNLFNYLKDQYKTTTKRRKYNPYYDAVVNSDTSTISTNSSELRNEFDVNQYSFRFTYQLISGLNFIHEHHIIHRDIKPQNILLNLTNLNLVITDFGISYNTKNSRQIIDETPDDKITDVSTSIYKAPELLLGVKNYTNKIDIWSLFIVISHFFIKETSSKNIFKNIPSFIFNSDDFENTDDNGSDIKLLLSIFETFGIPKSDEWPEVINFGSADAFIGMFGEQGDGKYILNDSTPTNVKKEKILSILPKLNDLSDESWKNSLIDCMLGMCSFESAKRLSCNDMLKIIQNFNK